MKSHLCLLALLSSFICHANAVGWYFLTWYPANGEKFISFSGLMATPPLPGPATYYIWPGLQPTDHSGVYQNVLDGRSGTWWFGTGWCCSNPSLPWGGGFSAKRTNVLGFNNTLIDATNWETSTKQWPTGTPVTNKFPLASKTFNQAIFAIELHGPSWDFGPLAFANILIKSTGTDKSWCNPNPSNYNGATKFTIYGLKATVVGNSVECHIDWLIMNGPSA